MASWEQISKDFDKRLDHEEIDEFLRHLNASLKARIRKLEEEGRNLSHDDFEDPREIDAYQSHLSELAGSSYAAMSLGDELSIIALYKKVETHTGSVLKNRLPASSTVDPSYFKQFCSALPFDIRKVKGFSGFNELRLLNNSIKHGGKVSKELAEEFTQWQIGDELIDLDKAFQRLLPEVKLYVSDLADRLHAASA